MPRPGSTTVTPRSSYRDTLHLRTTDKAMDKATDKATDAASNTDKGEKKGDDGYIAKAVGSALDQHINLEVLMQLKSAFHKAVGFGLRFKGCGLRALGLELRV